MKKLLFSALIVTTTTLVPTLPSLAKDCPSIPETLKAVTVKNNSANLRTEPKESSQKGSEILAGNKLKVMDNKPTQDSEGKDYCWYKVKLPNGSDAQQYWIAGIGLKEFSSWPISPSPTPTPSVSPTPDRISTPSSEKKSSIDWGAWVLASIGSIGIVVVLLAYDKINRSGRFNNSSVPIGKKDNLPSSNESLHLIVSKLDESLHLIVSKLDEYLPKYLEVLKKEDVTQDEKINEPESTVIEKDENINEPESTVIEKDEKDEKFRELNEKFRELEEKIRELEKIINGPGPNPQDDKKEWEKLVDKFNERKKEHFESLDLQFLNLNEESINDKPSSTGMTIMQLVSAKKNEASYFRVEADQENWLFPNITITSTTVDKIISNLKTSIFTRDPNLNNPQLKKPAKLIRDPGSKIWEIAECGEFIEYK
jgi:hypothetical protein